MMQPILTDPSATMSATMPATAVQMPSSPTTNTVGLLGFIFVVVALTGFCAAPMFIFVLPGTVLSAIGVFKKPRALAVAGLIIGLIETVMFLVVVVAAGVIIGAGVKGAQDAERLRVTSESTRTVSWAIDAYKRKHEKLPATLAEVSIGGSKNDGWGNPIRYEPKGGTYVLHSNGRDGKQGTADDMELHDSSYKPFSTTQIPTMPPARKPRPPATFPTQP